MAAGGWPNLLSPMRVGTMELRNRIAVTAMGVSLSEDDGSVGDRLIAYHEEQAKGGAGLIVLGVTGVAWPVGAVSGDQTAISDDRFLPGLTELCRRVHLHGAKVAAQLHHGGLVAAYAAARWGEPLWAPAIPPPPKGAFTDYFLSDELAGLDGLQPPAIKVLDEQAIALVVGQFAAAARRAKQAGFDGVEIHAGHGYLLSSFISPLTNSRSDAYGGPLENRARLALEVLAAVRVAVGPGFPVWLKIDSREVGKTGGITVDLAKQFAKLVEAAGADALTITAYHDTDVGKLHSESHTPHVPGWNLEAAAAIKSVVGIPVIASGRIEPDVADRAIALGQVDVVAMGRKLLADPHLPAKLIAGDAGQVRPCIYCYTCISAIYLGQPVRCAVNPELGFEARDGVRADATQHIVVIGGGPAGMEAARRLDMLGHRVTLIERGALLGGTLRFAALAYQPNERLLEWLRRSVEAADRVDVRLSTAADPALIAHLAPDAVIVASGAVRAMPDIPGSDLPHVFSGDDLRNLMLGESSARLAQKTGLLTRLTARVGAATGATANLGLVRQATKAWMPLGERVTIIGGELVGLELADFLVERGRKVDVLEGASRLGRGLPLVRRMRLLAELAEHGVGLHPDSSFIRVEAEAVHFTDGNGKARAIATDHVIVAQGARGDEDLANRLRDTGLRVHAIGDATGVGYIEKAMRSAADAVTAICGATEGKLAR